jgi:dTDP-4-dehydrorhamnose reductase
VTKSVLVLGRNGQVAWELQRLARERGVPLVPAGRETLDLLKTPDVEPLLDRIRPGAVVNATAYTDVERAEQEPDAAFRLNRDAPGAVARACAARDLPFVHFSTDYVFDGMKREAYVEEDPPAPLNVYGRSKVEGEQAVAAAAGRWAVLRTSWVYSATGRNFVTTMLRLAAHQPRVRVVDDEVSRPTWAQECAEAVLRLLPLLRECRGGGLYHLAGEGDASRADFARAIFEESARRGGPAAQVEPVSTAAFGSAVIRPGNARLDVTKLRHALGWAPAPWRQSLARCLDDRFGAGLHLG